MNVLLKIKDVHIKDFVLELENIYQTNVQTVQLLKKQKINNNPRAKALGIIIMLFWTDA